MNLPASSQVKITYSNRKTIGLYVSTKGIEVRAPHGTSERYIRHFVSSKDQWITKKLNEAQTRQSEQYQLRNGAIIPLLGEEKTLHIQEATRCQVVETTDTVSIQVSRLDQSRINKTFSDYLIAKAKQLIPELTLEVAQEIGLANKLKDIKFRRTKSKWGHCTHDGRLQFNWLIMMAPLKIIRSLVVHEVCHLAHLNHSTAFWALVEQHDPDYLLSKHWLNVHGHKLSLFE